MTTNPLRPGGGRALRATVLMLFFITGGCGLIYEILWTRLLRLVMGNTTHSITTVLAAFMGGLALGSYLGGRLADKRRRPLLVFGVIQLAIAAYCLALPSLISAYQPLYRLLYRHIEDMPQMLSAVRFALCGLLLLVPSTLMGATLPVLSRFFVRSRRHLGRSVGTLYAVNTFGAVAGAVATGFVLIPSLGMRLTLWVACGLSAAAGVVSFLLARRAGPLPAEAPPPAEPPPQAPDAPIPATEPGRAVIAVVLAGYALAGAAAMVYEIAWTRVISLLIGSTVYAFSMILTTFILGLAIGSWIAGPIVDRLRNPVRALGGLEILVGLSALAVLPFVDRTTLYLTDWLAGASAVGSFWRFLSIQCLVILAIVLLPTILMGMAFPLVTRLLARDTRSTPRTVAAAYSANTLGCILGSLVGGFVLIAWLGIQRTLFVAVMTNVLIGTTMLLVSRGRRLAARLGIAGAAVALAGGTVAWMPRWDPSLMSIGPFLTARRSARNITGSADRLEDVVRKRDILFHKEGLTTTVTVIGYADGARTLLANGKPDASTKGDLHTQLLLAHVPMLLHQRPRSVLVIGLASGISLGSAGLYNEAHTLDCAEISPAMVEACRYFDDHNYRILDDPRLRLLLVDGRNHLALTERKYDVISSEPPNPWVAGVADLFTREFYLACRDRLNDGGVACVFLESYNVDATSFRSVCRTFQDVFPNATLWSPQEGDYLLVGVKGPLAVDHQQLARRMARLNVAADLRRIDVTCPADLLTHLAMDARTLETFAADATIHTDDNALLEFAAPRTLAAVPRPDEIMDAIIDMPPPDMSFLTGSSATALAAARKRAATFNAARRHVLRGVDLNAKARNAQEQDDPVSEHLLRKSAADHFIRAARLNPSDRSLRKAAQNTLAEVDRLARNRDISAATQLARALVKISPRYAEARSALGQLLTVRRKLPEALDHFEMAVALEPKRLAFRLRLAGAALRLAQIDLAVKHYAGALELDAKNVQAMNALAFILSSDPRTGADNGPAAVKLALRAVQLTGHNDPMKLMTLSAAYANVGRFDEALAAARKALALSETGGNQKLSRQLRGRIALYANHTPYRRGSIAP